MLPSREPGRLRLVGMYQLCEICNIAPVCGPCFGEQDRSSIPKAADAHLNVVARIDDDPKMWAIRPCAMVHVHRNRQDKQEMDHADPELEPHRVAIIDLP